MLPFSKVHGLVASGGEDGAVECFDSRTKSSAGRIDAAASSGDIDAVINLFHFLSLWQTPFPFYLPIQIAKL